MKENSDRKKVCRETFFDFFRYNFSPETYFLIKVVLAVLLNEIIFVRKLIFVRGVSFSNGYFLILNSVFNIFLTIYHSNPMDLQFLCPSQNMNIQSSSFRIQ